MRQSPSQRFALMSNGRQKNILAATLSLLAAHADGAGALRAKNGNIILSSGGIIPHGRVGSEVVNAAVNMAYHEGLGSWDSGLRCSKAVLSAAKKHLQEQGLTAEQILDNPRFEIWRMKISPANEAGNAAAPAANVVNAVFLVEDDPFSLISITPLDTRKPGEAPVALDDGNGLDVIRFNRSPIADDLKLSSEATQGMASFHSALSESIRRADTAHTLIGSSLTEDQVLSLPGLRDLVNVSFRLTPEVIEETMEAGDGVLQDTIEHMNTFLDAQSEIIQRMINAPAPQPHPPQAAPRPTQTPAPGL